MPELDRPRVASRWEPRVASRWAGLWGTGCLLTLLSLLDAAGGAGLRSAAVQDLESVRRVRLGMDIVDMGDISSDLALGGGDVTWMSCLALSGPTLLDPGRHGGDISLEGVFGRILKTTTLLNLLHRVMLTN